MTRYAIEKMCYENRAPEDDDEYVYIERLPVEFETRKEAEAYLLGKGINKVIGHWDGLDRYFSTCHKTQWGDGDKEWLIPVYRVFPTYLPPCQGRRKHHYASRKEWDQQIEMWHTFQIYSKEHEELEIQISYTQTDLTEEQSARLLELDRALEELEAEIRSLESGDDPSPTFFKYTLNEGGVQ
jgi:hypothetical protein